MYDILVYVFENCQQTELAHDSDRVAKKLSAAGFEDSDISEALHWLDGVLHAPQARARPACPTRSASFRAYAPRETRQARRACRGFLLTLEHSGILSAADARAGDRALARRLRRHAHAGAAQAHRADGDVEPADAHQPPAGGGPVQRAARAPGELARALPRTTRRWLKRARVCTYHLRPFAPHGQKTHHRREAFGRRRHRAGAGRLHAQGRLLRERRIRALVGGRPSARARRCRRSTTSSAASGRSRTCR